MIATDKMTPMLIALRSVALPPSLFPPPLLLPPITCVCFNTFCSHCDHVQLAVASKKQLFSYKLIIRNCSYATTYSYVAMQLDYEVTYGGKLLSCHDLFYRSQQGVGKINFLHQNFNHVYSKLVKLCYAHYIDKYSFVMVTNNILAQQFFKMMYHKTDLYTKLLVNDISQ